MTEERALGLFARCYNKGDFTDVSAKLHRDATYESFSRFYVSQGKESVERLLREKAAELRALSKPNRAYRGFMMVRHDIIGLRCEPCLVLTRDDPREALGVVRIKCTVRHIRDIRVLDPAKTQFTRGEYAQEGR